MAKYIFDNEPFSEEELLEIAKERSVTLQELLEKNPEIKLSDDETEVTEEVITDPTKEGKEKPTTGEDATVVEEIVAPENTELVSENGSLEQPKTSVRSKTRQKELQRIDDAFTEEAKNNLLPELTSQLANISPERINEKIAYDYFNLEKVNERIEDPLAIGYGRMPSPEEKQQRVFNNAINLGGTENQANEDLKAYNNYIKTNKVVLSKDLNEYKGKLYQKALKDIKESISENVIGEYSEEVQEAANNIINKNKEFKTEEEAYKSLNQGSKLFNEQTDNYNATQNALNTKVSEIKLRTGIIDEKLNELSIKANGFENPIDYTNQMANEYNSLINEKNNILNGEEVSNIKAQEAKLAIDYSNIIDLQNTLTNKAIRINNEKIIVNALEKNYTYTSRAAIMMEKAFGGSGASVVAMAAKVGSKLLTASPQMSMGGVSFGPPDGLMEAVADNFLTASVDYNEAIDYKELNELPKAGAFKDVRKGDISFTRFIRDAIANGTPTLVSILGPNMAVGVLKTSIGKGMKLVAKQQALINNKSLSQGAASLSSNLLGLQAGGGEITDLQISKKNAYNILNSDGGLKDQLKKAVSFKEISELKNKIVAQENSLNVSTFKIAFAGITSAGIEKYTEKFGTLRVINQASNYSKTLAREGLSKFIAPVATFAKGLASENVEEIIAGIGNNVLVKNAILKQDISPFEGIDEELIANTTVVSAIMLGNGLSTNVRNVIKELTINSQESKQFKSLVRELIDLRNTDSNTRIKRSKEILLDLGFRDFVSLSKLAKMSPEALKELGGIQGALNKISREAASFGASLGQDVTASDKVILKRLQDEYSNLSNRKEKLISTKTKNLGEDLKFSLQEDFNSPTVQFELQAFEAFTTLALGLMPKNGQYIEFNNREELLKKIENINKTLSKDKQINLSEKNIKMFLAGNGFNIGDNVFINKNLIITNILASSSISDEGKFAAATPLHELSHIRNRKLLLNERLTKDALEDAKKIIKANKNKVSEREYLNFEERIALYDNETKKVQYEEMMQLLIDAQNMGIINSSDYIDFNSFKDLIKYIGAKTFGDTSEIFFKIESANDVFNYVNSFQTFVKKGQIIGSSDENEEEVKFSVSGYKTPEGRKIDDLVGGKDKDGNYIMTKAEWDAGGIKDAYNEVNKSDGLFQPTIRKGIQGDEIQGISRSEFDDNVKFKIVEILMKFNPEKNNSLSGYVNSLAFFKKGDALKEAKKTPTGRSLDTPAGETGSIREIGTEDEVDMDAFMAQTDAINESNITNLKLIKEEIKTSDGKKITKLKENIEREVREKGPKLTEKELTYKTSPDYGTPTILKAINNSFQNSTEFKKLYDAKSKQLDREIADGKTNREGQKISKANELQKFKTGYILRPEDFAGSGNLSQKKFPIVKDFIDQNIKLIIENLPKAAVTRKDPVSKKIENTSTGVPNNFLNNPNLYAKTEERIGNSGIFVYKKRKGITSKDIFEMLEGKPLVKGKFGLPMQNAKQFINNLGQFATNQELRLQDFITPQQSADLEGGKDSKILYSLNTKGDGKWVQNPLNPLDTKEKIYSFKVGDTDYNIKTSGHKVGSLDVNAYGFEIFDGNKFEEEFINGIANDDKSLGLLFADKDNNATQITGAALKGLTNQFKVFGIVANSTIDLIKKEKLNSITFNGREESRQKLYEAMVQKFKKELGWESYNYELEEGSGEAYIVYDPKVFTNPETAATTEKESRILFNKAIPLLQKNNILESVEKFQKNKSYTNLNDDVFNGIKGVIENSETYKQVFDGIKKLTFKTLGLNSQRKFERELLISLIGLADSKTKDSFIPAFETYRKLFKYEQQEVGYNFAVNYLNLKFKNAKGKEAKQEAITNFLKYISRSIKTLKINGITTNKAVFDKIIKPLVKENNLGFDVFEENKLTYITLDGEKLKGLKDINEIKKDFNGSIAKIKDESEAVLKYYIEIINEAKENNTVEQIKGLIALTAADQRGMLRKLSTPGFEIVAPGKKMILEHETTALELFNKLIDYAESIDNVGLDALKKFVSQAKVNLIPETLDKILNVKGYIGNGKARYKAAGFVKALQKYKDAGKFFNYAKESKNLLNLSKSKFKAAKNNNSKLPKSEQFPKSWWLSEAVTGDASQMVLDRLKEVDDRNNEARINFSKAQSLDETFNNIIEAKTGIETYKRFDRVEGAVKGSSKGKTNFFIPPSAEDFVGLLYKTLGKGKVGDRQMQFYKDNLLDPYGRAMNDVSSARVAMFEDYKALKENLNIIPKDLSKKGFEEYTREQAVRIYIWDQQGNKIPGMFKTNQQKLVDYVIANPDLKEFGDQLIAMQKGDGYVTPKEGWLAGTITTDLLDSVNSIKRKKYLEQWQTNVDEMFGESNMNKLEAAFGKPYRKALEDILGRMKSGRNKKFTAGNEQVDRWNNWVNNSVGTIMFLNSRSAILQTLSTVNFINFNDNNVFKAGAAFANQPQYWKDFMFLFNSDFLKERRGGLRFNVSESEIADAAKKGGAAGVVSKILQAGFLPTQMADSFAIASGGATFYRNRLNTYLKEIDANGNKVYTEAEAKEKTFLDFREIAEETQQSSRPDRISMEQAGPLGRTILAFANTPAQYTRILKKAALDIKYGRGDFKTNMSRLIYYGVVQNIIFGAIQAATFSLMFGDGDEEDQLFEEKAMRIANGTADSILRGAGLYGAIAATIKNTVIKLIKESKKPRTDYFEAGLVELAGISPPIQSKVKKWRNATKSYEYNKKEMAQKGFSIENPAYLAGANVIAAFTNVPTDRVVKKVTNVYDAVQEDVEIWKRTALLMGWSKWELEPTVKKAKTKKKKAIKKTNPRIRLRSSNSRARPSRARPPRAR